MYLSSFRVGNCPGQLVRLARGGRRAAVIANAMDAAPPEIRSERTVVAQSRGHGRGAIAAPQLRHVVFTNGGDELGMEPIRQRERVGEHDVVDRQVESVNRLG